VELPVHRMMIYDVEPHRRTCIMLVRFEVLTGVTMKNGVFWDVMPCGSCKNHTA
jgi:hypothetical protein